MHKSNNLINRLNSVGKVISKKKYYREIRIELYRRFYKDIIAKTFVLNENIMATNKILDTIKNKVNMESLDIKLTDDKISNAEKIINAYTFLHESINNQLIISKK